MSGPRLRLFVLFSFILIAMLAVTGWASFHTALWNAGPQMRAPWPIATLFDAYAGFLTFFAWVVFKERRMTSRVAWFVGIMTLGNIAMAAYVLRELFRIGPNGSMADLLVKKNG